MSDCPHDAFRGIDDSSDIDYTKNQQPAVRINGDEVLEKNDDARSQRGAEQRPTTAQGNHQKHLHRSRELQVHRAHETVVVSPQHTGEAADATGNDEADVFVQPHVIAKSPHARLTLPDSEESLSERGANDEAKYPEGDEKAGERKIVKGDRKSERQREAEIWTGNRRDTVVPLSHRDPAVSESPDHHAESESDH